METRLNERHFALAATGLSEISEEFFDEIESRPSSLELFEILSWGLKSCRDDTLLDVNPVTIIALKPKIKKGYKQFGSSRDGDEKESVVDDLNDNLFVVANDLISELAKTIKLDTKQAPTLDELCTVIVEGLHRCNEDLLIDISPNQIVGIKTEIRKQAKKNVSKIGDIVAIPAKNGEFFIACILTKNCFGTAYGFFEGTSQLRPISVFLHQTTKRYPIYSDDESVATGKWQIIGHDEKLLSLFPAEPEIYHSDQILDDGLQIGPYGSGETASGQLRHLTKEEAEEIGLLNGEYSQVYLSEELENYLNKKLE